MSEGNVLQIFICPSKGEPMQEVAEVLAVEGRGLEEDRYAKGQGSYATGRNHVTLIASEAIRAANEKLQEPFASRETRRNIVTRNVDLNRLVGKEFLIGEAWFRGVRLCPPCKRPAIVGGRGSAQGKLFEKAFENQGGLNAEVLRGGIIKAHDRIAVVVRL